MKRGLLLALAGCFVVLLLTSCGGGGGPGGPQPPPVITGETQGKVDTASIGVQNPTDLQVQSVWDDQPAPVNRDGSFKATVAQNKVQLLVLTDNEKLRGLALSFPPSKAGRRAEVTEINAETIAKILIFLSPGILTTDPDKGRIIWGWIGELSSLKPLVDFLENALKQYSLLDIITDAQLSTQLNNYLEPCIEEYFSKHPKVIISEIGGEIRANRGGFQTSTTFKHCWAEVTDSSNITKVQINLKNNNWRNLTLFEALADANNNKTYISVEPLLIGIRPISLELLFDWMRGHVPGSLAQNVNFTNLNWVEFWAIGPGNPFISQPQIPDEIKNKTEFWTNAASAWAGSAITYIILPVIDILSTVSITNAVYDELKSIKDITMALDTLGDWVNFYSSCLNGKINWKNRKEVAKILLPLVTKTFKALFTNSKFKEILGKVLAESKISNLLRITKVFTILQAAAQLSATVGDWATMPATVEITVVKSPKSESWGNEAGSLLSTFKNRYFSELLTPLTNTLSLNRQTPINPVWQERKVKMIYSNL